MSKNTGTEYAVAKMLEKGGLTEKDIEITEVPQVPSRLELLKNKQAQAAILPEPFVTMAVADGLKVLDSTIEIGANLFVMGFESNVIDEKSEAIFAMYKADDDAVDWMNSHDKEDYIQLFIDEVGFPDTLKDQITVPACFYSVLSTSRVSLGTAISVLFFTENYGTEYGMDYFIMDSWMGLDYKSMYGAIILLSLMGLGLFLIVDLIGWFFTKWERV